MSFWNGSRPDRLRSALPAATILVAGLVLAASAVVLQVARGQSEPSDVLYRAEPPALLVETSLLEAWQTASEVRDGWAGRWVLLRAYSVDVHDDGASRVSGVDGRRLSWHFELASLGEERLIRVTGGRVVDVGRLATRPQPLEAWQLDVREVKIPETDTPAIASTLAEIFPDFSGADEAPVGVHFSLERDWQTGEVVFRVMGVEHGSRVALAVGASSGASPAAEAQEWHGGGLHLSADGGRSWRKVDVDGVPLGAAVSGDRSRVYLTALQGGDLVLLHTEDGFAWSLAATLPHEAGDWVYDVAVTGSDLVWISTVAGLWAVELTTGMTSQVEDSLNRITMFQVASSGDLHAIEVLGAGDSRHVVRAAEGWQVVEMGVSRLFLSADGDVRGFVHWGSDSSGLLPQRTGDAAWTGDAILAASDEGVLRCLGVGTCEVDLAGPSVRVARAPQPGSALATLLSGGLWRYDPDAQAWSAVLDIAALDVWGIHAFSENKVLVIEGGSLTWSSAD